MTGAWPGSDCASIAPSFAENHHGKLENMFCYDLWKSWKVTYTSNAPKIVLGGPSCPQHDLWWSTVPPNIKKQTVDTHTWQKGKLATSKFENMCTDKSTRLVWLKLSQLERSAIWWRKGFPYIHGLSMKIHGYSLDIQEVSIDNLRISMNIHDISRYQRI